MIDDHGRNRLPGDGYTLHACNLRPRSRGRITLTGDRATDKPRIEANYLGDPEGFDLKVMVECARIPLDILAQKAFDDYRGAPLFPARTPRNEAELVEFVRAKAETVYHAVGTCRMGSDDAAVAAAPLRLSGVEWRSVGDAAALAALHQGTTTAMTNRTRDRQ